MNQKQINLDRYKPFLEKIVLELNQTINRPIPNIQEIWRYSLLGEGKRLRPLLFVLAAQLCGHQRTDLFRLSIIFELIHTGSLLHDDVIDNAEKRRKKPSVRNVWGNLTAVLGGDYFYALATAFATESNSWEFLAKLNQASVHMVEGQLLELSHTHNGQIDKPQYLEIIKCKTADLIAAACACGAIIAGGKAVEVEEIERFGLNFGLAFQMMDDVLDYISCEEVFGKPVGNDLKEGKITLPLIYTLEKLDRAEAERICHLLKNHEENSQEQKAILQMVRENGAIERVKAEVRDYLQKSSACLDHFPPSPAREDLMILNDYMAQRTF